MVIERLTDTDLYKCSMGMAAWRQYPKAVGRYELAVRTKNPKFPLADIADDIRDEVNSMASLRLTTDEGDFISGMPWFKPDYIDFLGNLRLNPERDVKVTKKPDGGIGMSVRGLWHEGIYYEVPALAIVSELYCRKAYGLTEDAAITLAIEKLRPKIEMLKKHPRLGFTDFGTRRRFSKAVQHAVLKYIVDSGCKNLVGTSNIWFAKEFGLKAIGTVAHEWTMAHLALVDRLDQAQKRAMHVWLQEYVDQIGTALTDTFTTEAFWRDFDVVLARAHSGVRQDSGDPFAFGWKAIEHYKALGIDPRTKSIIFSDSLDFPKMIELFETFVGLIGIGFGIGTNLTNDLGFDPLSVVMKLMELNGIPLVKLGDGGGKVMSEADEMTMMVRRAYRVTT